MWVQSFARLVSLPSVLMKAGCDGCTLPSKTTAEEEEEEGEMQEAAEGRDHC